MKAQPNDVIVGAAAGVVATVPMTIVMEELHRALAGEHDGPLPPRECSPRLAYDITRATTRWLGAA